MNNYLYANEPATAVAAANRLACLPVLSEVHIHVVFHILLPCRSVRESNTTLLTLYWEAIKEEMHDFRTLPEMKRVSKLFI